MEGNRYLRRHLIDEQWFQSILDASLDCIIAIDHDDTIVEFNHAAEATFGYSADYAVGRKLSDLIIPERYREKHLEAMRDYVATGTGHVIGKRVEVSAIRADGSEFPVELTVLPVHPADTPYFTAYLRDISDKKRAEAKIKEYSTKLKVSLIETINSVSTTIELRDPYTAGHQRRVAALAVAIGKELGLNEDRLEGLFLGGMVHDIGKIAIPKTTLNETGKLTREQWDAIRFHPAAGFKIVQSVEFPWPIGKMIREHHERFDGSGYPDKLAGEDILLEARIIAVADVVEAIHSSRPYRPALGFEAALDEIMRGSGSKYDPKVVNVCRDLLLLKGFNILDNPIMRRDLKDLSFLKG